MFSAKKIQEQIIPEVQIHSFLNYRDYIKALFQEIQAHHSDFSLKDFAELLGYSRKDNTISLIMKGQRVLSEKKVDQIAESLALGSKKTKYFAMMVRYTNEKKAAKRDEYFQGLLDLRKKRWLIH